MLLVSRPRMQAALRPRITHIIPNRMQSALCIMGASMVSYTTRWRAWRVYKDARMCSVEWRVESGWLDGQLV